jgi:hypothetical protein
MTPAMMTDQEYAWRSERERCIETLAEWMANHGFATGHGDSMEDLLKELAWQVAELRQKLQYAQRNAS